ncbi:MAG TPA: cupredoxin family copper-binding protein [Terriglobales bacterium]|nr:cupredoxin family copper-binding protein [Terriglobales bacterium]
MNRNKYGVSPIFMFLVAVALLALASTAKPSTLPTKTVQVSIHLYKFTPATVTVHPGDTVEWKNDDTVDHTATATGAGTPAFDSGNLKQGQIFKYVAKTKGTYDYICTIHPYMKGQVIVR